MTTTSSEPTTPTTPADLRLGRDVVRRMRLPGPPVGRPLPSRIGSLASSVSRFAAATSRPVDVRRALVGPDPRGLGASAAPPRWWTPVAPEPEPTSAPAVEGAAVRRSAVGAAPAATPSWLAPARPVSIRRLPERSLPRAAREVPNETTWTPGGIVGGLRGEVARVRRHDEVAAVGPMLTQNDRAKLNAGMAARQANQAAAQQASSQSTVRRATTRAPRQGTTASSPTPSASEPPTAPSAAPSAPGGGASATVSATSSAASVAQTPPPAAGVAATTSTPGGGASATVSATSSAASVAQTPPPAAGAPATPGGGASATVAATSSATSVAQAPLRRVARPSWQLRSQQSRFDGLVRRTPSAPGRTPAASHPTAPGGLAGVVSRLATPARVRTGGAATATVTREGGLESSVRSPETVPAAGPGLIAAGADAPATVRRHAWSTGSLVMRQAADARTQAGTLSATRAAAPLAATATAPAATAHRPQSSSPAAASTASAPAAPAVVAAPAARTAEPVVRRLPSAVGGAPVTAPDTQFDTQPAAQTSGASASVPGQPSVAGTPPSGSPAAAAAAATADQRRLPRLWRRATDVRPATDVRSSVPAPAVRLASDTAAPATPAAATSPTIRRSPATGGPVTSAPARATGAGPSSTLASTPPGPAAAGSTPPAPSPAAPAVQPAAQHPADGQESSVRRTTAPVTRVGAHVATPGFARAQVGMPELMTIRRATAHGTDSNRTLATGFGAPQSIRPAGSPVAAPVAAVAGESRLWRRATTPSGAVRDFGAGAPVPGPTSVPTARSGGTAGTPSGARASTPAGRFAAGLPSGPTSGPAPSAAPGRPPGTGPTAPIRRTPAARTWQPWQDAPTGPASPQGPARATTFPAGPPGAASAPTGRTPAADVRRLTVAPPRISVAPSQPPAPPVPEVARRAASAQQPSSLVRRSNTSPGGPGGSLVDSTAHLFATPDAPLVRRAVHPGGSSMSSLTPRPSPGSPTIRRQYGDDSSAGQMSDTTLSAEATDRLVDKVVERIERRVVEELERRGRSHGRGGY